MLRCSRRTSGVVSRWQTSGQPRPSTPPAHPPPASGCLGWVAVEGWRSPIRTMNSMERAAAPTEARVATKLQKSLIGQVLEARTAIDEQYLGRDGTQPQIG